tara:strand:- start:70 stop:1092 length:1023 start_codon:yes stop_codon:yes gene_type:complete
MSSYHVSQDIQSLLGSKRFHELIGKHKLIEMEYRTKTYVEYNLLGVAIYLKSFDKKTQVSTINEIKYIEFLDRENEYLIVNDIDDMETEDITYNLYQVIQYEWKDNQIQNETYGLYSCKDVPTEHMKQKRIDLTNTNWEEDFLENWIETDSERLLMDPLLKTIKENYPESNKTLLNSLKKNDAFTHNQNNSNSVQTSIQTNKITNYFTSLSQSESKSISQINKLPATRTTSTATTSTATMTNTTVNKTSSKIPSIIKKKQTSAKIVPKSILQEVRKDQNGNHYTKKEYVTFYKNTYQWDLSGLYSRPISERKLYFDYCGYIDEDGHDLDWYIYQGLIPYL